MSITTTGYGKIFRVGTSYDLNNPPFTTITLRFTSPDGLTTFDRTNPDVSAPAVDSPPTEIGIIPANTYMQYETQAGDFTQAGDWEVCAIWEDATRRYPPDAPSILTVLEGC